MNDTHEVRYCRNKKCHCELMSTNKKGLCEDCRRKRNEKFKEVACACGGVVSLALAAVFSKNGGIKKQ